jgi:hypothetical protein
VRSPPDRRGRRYQGSALSVSVAVVLRLSWASRSLYAACATSARWSCSRSSIGNTTSWWSVAAALSASRRSTPGEVILRHRQHELVPGLLGLPAMVVEQTHVVLETAPMRTRRLVVLTRQQQKDVADPAEITENLLVDRVPLLVRDRHRHDRAPLPGGASKRTPADRPPTRPPFTETAGTIRRASDARSSVPGPGASLAPPGPPMSPANRHARRTPNTAQGLGSSRAVALLVAHSPDSEPVAAARKTTKPRIYRGSEKRARQDSNLRPSVP